MGGVLPFVQLNKEQSEWAGLCLPPDTWPNASPDHARRLSGSECSRSCDTSSVEVQAKLVPCHKICTICCPLCLLLLASPRRVRVWVPHSVCKKSVPQNRSVPHVPALVQHESQCHFTITINYSRRLMSHSISLSHTHIYLGRNW